MQLLSNQITLPLPLVVGFESGQIASTGVHWAISSPVVGVEGNHSTDRAQVSPIH